MGFYFQAETLLVEKLYNERETKRRQGGGEGKIRDQGWIFLVNRAQGKQDFLARVGEKAKRKIERFDRLTTLNRNVI